MEGRVPRKEGMKPPRFLLAYRFSTTLRSDFRTVMRVAAESARAGYTRSGATAQEVTG